MRLLQKSESVFSINVGRARVVKFMKLPVEAIRVLIKAVRVPLVIVGEPKEAARVYNTLTASTTLSRPQQHSHGLNNTLMTSTTLSRPQQHSHSREKVLVNFLLQAS